MCPKISQGPWNDYRGDKTRTNVGLTCDVCGLTSHVRLCVQWMCVWEMGPGHSSKQLTPWNSSLTTDSKHCCLHNVQFAYLDREWQWYVDVRDVCGDTQWRQLMSDSLCPGMPTFNICLRFFSTGNNTRGFCLALSPSRKTTGLTSGDAPSCACAWPPLFCRNITGAGWAVPFIAASGRKSRSGRKRRREGEKKRKSRRGA